MFFLDWIYNNQCKGNPICCKYAINALSLNRLRSGITALPVPHWYHWYHWYGLAMKRIH